MAQALEHTADLPWLGRLTILSEANAEICKSTDKHHKEAAILLPALSRIRARGEDPAKRGERSTELGGVT
jgi:hypothetical protein